MAFGLLPQRTALEFFLRNLQPSPRCANLVKFLFIFFLAGVAPLMAHLAPARANGQTPGTWTTSGSLNTPRAYHTSTLLPNGQVLVAGGKSSIGYGMSSAILYNYTTGTWTATGFFTYARSNHTATLLPNGLVLVAGGTNYWDFPDSAELYDPSSGTWTTSGSLNTPRVYHTSTLLPNGKVLVARGQYTSILDTAELYDQATGTWSPTGPLTVTRRFHTATLLPNGKVLVAGGWGMSGYLASAEVYDPATEIWTATGSLDTSRFNHTATLLPNGKVLIAGGQGGAAPGVPVFTRKGKPITGSTIRVGFGIACKRAGVENLCFHDLRHCFVTNKRRAGVHESVIMAITGHKTRAMFDRYNSVSREEVKAAVEASAKPNVHQNVHQRRVEGL